MRSSFQTRYRNRAIKEKLIIIGLIIGAIVLIIGAVWIAAVAGGKLTKVITYNTGFWIMMFVSFVFGIYRKLTNPREFTWSELPIQLLVAFVVTVGLYALAFSTSADLMDTEILNGYFQKAEYYEEWKEKVTYTEQVADGKDSNGNTKYKTVTRTRIDYHPPNWQIVTSLGTISIDKQTYRNYVRHLGNEKKKNMFRMNQVSIGDGDMFYVSHSGAHDDKLIPVSTNHTYVNYLKASDSIRKVSGAISGYSGLIANYPRVHSGHFGDIYFDRVVNAGVSLPANWSKAVDSELDRSLTVLGYQKQVNVVVYTVNTADQGFAYALEEAWVRGKKNDVIVIIGSTNFPNIDFVYVMAWTKIEEFKIQLRDRILSLENMSDPQAITTLIIDQISKSPNQGGFLRMPMADLEYLIADIRLPLWCQILIIVVGALASWVTSHVLINNQTKN